MTGNIPQGIIPRDFLAGLLAASGSLSEFHLKRVSVHVLEMEDVLFHLNSAVMMPSAPAGKSSNQGGGATPSQIKVSGLEALALVFKQFEFDDRKRLLITAHTDTSGEPKFNFELSDLRAQNVLYLIEGKRDDWAAVSESRHKVEDYQQIMTFLAKNQRWKWACDPLGIDDSWGPHTMDATGAFVKSYNDWLTKRKLAAPNYLPLSADLPKQIDKNPKHKWPKELWHAVYDLYEFELAAALKATPEALAARYRPLVKFTDYKKETRYVACGESFPINSAQKSNYRSQTNRRVELLFFDKNEMPLVDCPTDISAVHSPVKCPIWHKRHFRPTYINPEDLNATAYHLRFVYYDRMQKKMCDVPDGLPIKVIENGSTEVKSSVSYSGGVYLVKVPDNTARTDIHFEFKTDKPKWLFTKDSGAAPEVVDTPAKLDEMAIEERLKYYDLPQEWSSQNYWTRYDGSMDKGERFLKVLKEVKKIKPYGGGVTGASQPLIFSLDDIVLLTEAGSQAVKDKFALDAAAVLSDKSRYTLFYVKDDKLVHFKPESADYPYFTDFKFKENLIRETPQDGQVRMIAFANDFYHVYDKRAGRDASFDAAKHVLGCRAASLKDSKWHVSVKMKGDSNTWGHQRYFAKSTGNFELHYIHDGCVLSGPDKIKRRAFLLVYWNGFFKSQNAPHAVAAIDVTNFSTKGIKNAFERWEHKGYTIEPLKDDGSCDIQIKPVFFFEAKRDNRGGKPKCTVTVSSNTRTGWMGIGTSDMYKEDYKVRDYLGVGQFRDIDSKIYETLVISHEFSHAMGKDDEYAYHEGDIAAGFRNADDGVYSQYYLGSPYQLDNGSMMLDNRAPRMKQLWFFVNWLNDAAKDVSQLKPFLKDSQFKLVHRYGTNKLNYHLVDTPADYRDIYAPAKSKKRLSVGTGDLDVGLYKLGEDEMARNISVGGRRQAFAFDGVLVVFLKLSLNFASGTVGASDSSGNWNPAAQTIIDDWKTGLLSQIKALNNRFYLANSAAHDFKNTYVYLFPVCLFDSPTAVTHYDINVVMDGTDAIKNRSGKTLKVGNEVSKPWVVNYILGKNDGALQATVRRLFGTDKPGKNELGFLKTWIEGEFAGNTFNLMGS